MLLPLTRMPAVIPLNYIVFMIVFYVIAEGIRIIFTCHVTINVTLRGRYRGSHFNLITLAVLLKMITYILILKSCIRMFI